MTARSDVTAATAALAEVAQQGLLHVDSEVVRQAAMAVWHGQGRVDLDEVHGPFLSEAVSLLERLSFYNVVSQERKKALLGQVRKLRGANLVPVSVPGFETAYRRFLPELQPLQTRHFAAA